MARPGAPGPNVGHPRFELKGAKAAEARIRKAIANGSEKALVGLRLEAEYVMAKSKQEFVPVDEGALRSSGHVGEPQFAAGKDVEIELRFGGPSAAYAVAIHEHPGEFDPPSWKGKDITFSPSGRGPKYLERPLMEAVAGMAERIALFVDQGLGS